MKISVINVGLFCLCFLSNSYATSDEWSQRWKASSTRTNDNLVQANLIGWCIKKYAEKKQIEF